MPRVPRLSGSAAFFPLHGLHSTCQLLTAFSAPPRETGTMWSSVSSSPVPQCAQHGFLAMKRRLRGPYPMPHCTHRWPRQKKFVGLRAKLHRVGGAHRPRQVLVPPPLVGLPQERHVRDGPGLRPPPRRPARVDGRRLAEAHGPPDLVLEFARHLRPARPAHEMTRRAGAFAAESVAAVHASLYTHWTQKEKILGVGMLRPRRGRPLPPGGPSARSSARAGGAGRSTERVRAHASARNCSTL